MRRMRYTTPDEARSDLFLSGAVFLFGPLILGLVFDTLRISSVPVVNDVLQVLLPLLTTLLVPYLLIRYRKETIGEYTRPGGGENVVFGLLMAAPIVLASLLPFVLEPTVLPRAVPVLLVTQAEGALLVVQRLALWVGLVGLAVYATVKARDAFRLDPKTLREAVIEIGRVLAIVAAVAAVLLLVTGAGSPLELFLPPLGVAASVWLGLRRLRGPSSTSRSVLLTPTVLLALGVFTLSFNALAFVQGAYNAALFGGVGLLVGLCMEGRRSGTAALVLALAIALLSPFPTFG
jgi:hypothetical protein